MNQHFFIPELDTYSLPFVSEELVEHDQPKAAPASLPLPDTIIQELAVLPFSDFDRKAFYDKFLSAEQNKKKMAENKAKFAGYKVSFATFLSQLEKYVDLGIIETVYKQLYPSENVVRNTTNFDEIVTEAVHQFQLKCSNSFDYLKEGSKAKKVHNAIVDSDVLDNLGFVFHKGRNRYKAKKIVEDILKAISPKIKAFSKAHPIAALNDVNGSNWYSYRCNPVIFGRKGNSGNGYSVFFVLELRKAEAELFKIYMKDLDYAFDRNFLTQFNSLNTQILEHVKLSRKHGSYPGKGCVPHVLGNILDIHADHSDIRNINPKKPADKGFHFSGMAIDIKYDLNPYVSGDKGLARLKEAAVYNNEALNKGDVTKQIDVTKIDAAKNASKYFHNLGIQFTTAEIYEHLKTLSESFIKKKISEGKSRLKVNWGISQREPNQGFLNLNKDLVVVLRDKIGLAWGALDFGDTANGDMMHFDMRTSELGQAYGSKTSSSKLDTFCLVHPKFKNSEVCKTQKIEHHLPEQTADSWISTLMQKMNSFLFWASKAATVLIYLPSIYLKGEKLPEKLTDQLFFEIIYPELKGKPGVKNTAAFNQDHWNALFNFVVSPFLLLFGRAIKTLAGNLLVPNAGNTPLLLQKNEYGLVLFPLSGPGFLRYTNNTDDSYKHPVTKAKGKHGDNWIDPQTGADFYNAIQDFRATPNGQNVIIHYGDVSAYDPAIDLGHKTHKGGKAIDIHYFGTNGEEFRGNSAYKQANIAKMNAFFKIVQAYNFVNNFSYGKRYTHSGFNNHSGHKDHFHISQVVS